RAADAIKRIAKETRAPLTNFLLARIGVKAVNIRIALPALSLFEIGVRTEGLVSREGFQRSLRPLALQLFNASPAEPVLTAIHLFAEWSPDSQPPVPLAFVRDQHYFRSWSWSIDFLQSLPTTIENATL